MIEEFEFMTGVTSGSIINHGKHHEQTKSFQSKFAEETRALVSAFTSMGNPFEEDSGDLFNINSKDVMDECVINSIRNIKKLGKTGYTNFVQERLVSMTKDISAPIPRTQPTLFRTTPAKPTKQKVLLDATKSDSMLFSRMYIACQTRDGDIDKFFQYENQPYPPAISDLGKLRKGNKSDLVTCLEQEIPDDAPNVPDTADAKVRDGVVLVQMIPPYTILTPLLFSMGVINSFYTSCKN